MQVRIHIGSGMAEVVGRCVRVCVCVCACVLIVHAFASTLHSPEVGPRCVVSCLEKNEIV